MQEHFFHFWANLRRNTVLQNKESTIRIYIQNGTKFTLVGLFGIFEKGTLANKMAPPGRPKFQSQTIVKVFHKFYISGKIHFLDSTRILVIHLLRIEKLHVFSKC